MASHCCGPLPWVLLSIVIVRVGSMKPQQLPLRALPFVPARIGWQRQSARMSAGALRSETTDGTADGAEPANEPLAEELRSTRLPSLRIASPVTAIFLWACPLLALIGPGEHRLVLRTTLGMLQPAVYRIKPSVLNMKPVLLALAPTLTSDLSRGFSLLAVAPLLPTLLERVLYMLHALSQLGSRALSPGDTTPTDYRDSLLQVNPMTPHIHTPTIHHSVARLCHHIPTTSPLAVCHPRTTPSSHHLPVTTTITTTITTKSPLPLLATSCVGAAAPIGARRCRRRALLGGATAGEGERRLTRRRFECERRSLQAGLVRVGCGSFRTCACAYDDSCDSVGSTQPHRPPAEPLRRRRRDSREQDPLWLVKDEQRW